MAATTTTTMRMPGSSKHALLAVGLVLGLFTATNNAFVIKPTPLKLQQTATRGALPTAKTALNLAPSAEDDPTQQDSSSPSSLKSRREAFAQAVAAATCLGVASSINPLPALAAEGIGARPDSPIVVLGAGGKVGKLCTQILSQKGLYTRAVTRSGRSVLDRDSEYVTYAPGDVTNYEALSGAIKGASGVIFAASASGKNKGGDPAHVDYLGAYNTAKACLEANVPKLVLVSAGTATRPDSAGFKATNFFVKYVYGDKIMDYKIAGEAATRDLYAAANKPNCGYAVVRPGGLSDRASAGPAKVHVSQGDVYSSEVTREDVAEVSVAALLKGKSTNGVTFELNQVEGLGKAMGTLPDLPAELIHTGAPTFDALLDGLLTDEEIKKKYPDLISDFRGSGIEPVSRLA